MIPAAEHARRWQSSSCCFLGWTVRRGSGSSEPTGADHQLRSETRRRCAVPAARRKGCFNRPTKLLLAADVGQGEYSRLSNWGQMAEWFVADPMLRTIVRRGGHHKSLAHW